MEKVKNDELKLEQPLGGGLENGKAQCSQSVEEEERKQEVERHGKTFALEEERWRWKSR